MGQSAPFCRVKLFSGVIYRTEDDFERVKEHLIEVFSIVDHESPAIVFDTTYYYFREMGEPLRRRFISFQDLILPDALPDIKVMTNQLEADTSEKNQRRINLDPGYLSDVNVVIATTKNYTHRIPLQKGIYAHLEYVIRKGKVEPLSWTYPDFHKPEYQQFFMELYRLYKSSIKVFR